jgi:hypothetical protein
MKTTRPAIVVKNCTTCGESCQVAHYSTYWFTHTVKIRQRLARIAGEMLSPAARTCDQWTHWVRVCERYLWRIMWGVRSGRVDAALIPAMLRFVEKHSPAVGPAILCATLPTHQPEIGDFAHLSGRPFQNNPFSERRYADFAYARWVRCEKHDAWCAVGRSTSDGQQRHDFDMRRIAAMHLAARISRSCDEFRARKALMAESPPPEHENQFAWFSQIDRKRWQRTDSGRDAAVSCSAATWMALAPALAPWSAVAAASLDL